MKFRAVIHDQHVMRELLNVILTLSKLTKKCIMKISSQKIYFIVNEDTGNTSPLVWAEICTEQNFTEYLMEGVNDQHQDIMLSFNPTNLARAIMALRTGAKYCKIKLTNVQYPCLTIDMEVQSSISDRYRQIVHDVPVDVIPRVDWVAFPLPEIPNSDIFLTLASNRTIRSHIDKLKNHSPSITFYAKSNGEMSVAAETELMTITTRYKNLDVNKIKANAKRRESGTLEASCTVSSKKMAIFFSSLQFQTPEWSCGISPDNVVHLQIDVSHGLTFHSVIPAVYF
ncbi:checkpoint protein HUS1 [Episyrphus balteatus]|uniref:checkpoint protein HUS1 n=1 Tax=Episyrphus balteatus TaxID=286459 RepID=UPI002485FCAF|nr:checkpoint protein HUS1 [Episyrphus balteatus]